ncbi:hypothetical protein J5X84_11915 [Streptosporangiaceae bacterium NEAU-GS5]|nr:hypothetical protein [Streptosporangiaceae bacterium NEAU-GS5]
MSARALIAAMAGVILVLVAVILALVLSGGGAGEGTTDAGATGPQTRTSAQVPATTAPVQEPSPSPLPWDKGQCVNANATAEVPSFDGVTVVPCESATAKAKILALAGNPARTCPKDTDGFARSSGQDTACIRNLAGPHPGDPGKGGGILRTGDCVYIATPSDSEDTAPQERACYDRYGPGRIWGFYKKKSQCKRPDGFFDNHYTNRRDSASTPFICTTEGYDVQEPGPAYAKGKCVREPASFKSAFPNSRNVIGGLHTVGCGAKSAWAKVVGSVSEQRCPRGTTHQFVDTDAYPSTTCLRTL